MKNKIISLFLTVFMLASAVPMHSTYEITSSYEMDQGMAEEVTLGEAVGGVAIVAAALYGGYKLLTWFSAYASEVWLRNTYTKLIDKYERERDILNTRGRAHADEIRHFVVTESDVSGSAFSRAKYVNAIGSDIKNLKHAIDTFVYTHSDCVPSRTSNECQLLKALVQIKSCVITDKSYRQEAVEYEKDQRRKERISVEGQKANAEQRKARADERRARVAEAKSRKS